MKKPTLSELTLREKIGQMLVLSCGTLCNVSDVKTFLDNNPYGSLWAASYMKMTFLNEFNENNMPGYENKVDYMNVAAEVDDRGGLDYNLDLKYRAFKEKYTGHYKVPLLYCLDAESGLRSTFHYYASTPNATAIGATNDPEYAYKYGKSIARELKAAGVGWVWSPVADRPSPFAGSSIGRTYSSNRELATDMVVNCIKGIQSENIASGLKHFPGSDKYEYRDTHICAAVLTQNYDDWYEHQGKIFEEAINAGVYSIMIKHLAFPAVDDTIVNGNYLPSTLSKKVITDLLKGKFGFKGVVITDDLNMRAVRSAYPEYSDMLVALINAGNDVLLGVTGPDTLDIIEKAVLDGRIPMERIDDGCSRVLDMKEKIGMFDKQEDITLEDRKAAVEATKKLNKEAAPKIISWVNRTNNLVPVKSEDIKKVHFVYIGYSPAILNNGLKAAKEEFEARGATVTISEGITDENHIQQIADENDLVVYFAHLGAHSPMGMSSFYNEKARYFFHVLTKGAEKSICVSTGSPFIFNDWFRFAKNFVNLYTPNDEVIRTFVRGVYGECEFTGKSPFGLNPMEELIKLAKAEK